MTYLKERQPLIPANERAMRAKDHRLPESGPGSNPVLYGVAHGLNELFPPVELSPLRNEDEERIEDGPTVADDRCELPA